MTKKKNYILDGMMGLIAGDALGCPVQFRDRYSIRNRPQGPVTGMEGYGTFNKPKGSWTDDSSMAIATLISIRELGKIDADDIMQRFCDWNFNGAYTPFGYAYDQGITCTNAIYDYAQHKDVKSCGKTGEKANGNGALMRILPVCIYYILRKDSICTSDNEAIEAIHLITALTHNHIRSYIASGLYYFMAKEIIDAGNGMDAAQAGSLTSLLQRGLDKGFQYYRQDLNYLAEMSHYSRTFDLSSFANLQDQDIRSSGYVVHSFEAAIWCLITTDNFKDCLLKCVNLGDDADTVAAIAGGLAGLYYGIDSMPSDWLDVIQKRDWLMEVLS